LELPLEEAVAVDAEADELDGEDVETSGGADAVSDPEEAV